MYVQKDSSRIKKIKAPSISTKYRLGYLTEGFEPSTSPDPSLGALSN